MKVPIYLTNSSSHFVSYNLHLLGHEIYLYQEGKADYSLMHTLMGTFIAVAKEVRDPNGVTAFPIKLSFLPKFARTIYFQKQQDQ